MIILHIFNKDCDAYYATTKERPLLKFIKSGQYKAKGYIMKNGEKHETIGTITFTRPSSDVLHYTTNVHYVNTNNSFVRNGEYNVDIYDIVHRNVTELNNNRKHNKTIRQKIRSTNKKNLLHTKRNTKKNKRRL